MKEFGVEEGEDWYSWMLKSGQEVNVDLSTRLEIQSTSPLVSEVDRHHLEEMLNVVNPSIISPSPLRKQLLSQFNPLFSPALDKSLYEVLLDSKIDYSFTSYKG